MPSAGSCWRRYRATIGALIITGSRANRVVASRLIAWHSASSTGRALRMRCSRLFIARGPRQVTGQQAKARPTSSDAARSAEIMAAGGDPVTGITIPVGGLRQVDTRVDVVRDRAGQDAGRSSAGARAEAERRGWLRSGFDCLSACDAASEVPGSDRRAGWDNTRDRPRPGASGIERAECRGLFPTVFRHELLEFVHLATGYLSHTEAPPGRWRQGLESMQSRHSTHSQLALRPRAVG